jgi:hypothetical protein
LSGNYSISDDVEVRVSVHDDANQVVAVDADGIPPFSFGTSMFPIGKWRLTAEIWQTSSKISDVSTDFRVVRSDRGRSPGCSLAERQPRTGRIDLIIGFLLWLGRPRTRVRPARTTGADLAAGRGHAR